MYLLDVSEINSVLSEGSATGTRCGAEQVDKFHSVLMLVTSRVEELLEIETLKLTSLTDTFQVDETGEVTLRLSGAFLSKDPEAFVIRGRSGEIVEDLDPFIDYTHGVATVYLTEGRYHVTYTQGFPVNKAHVYLTEEQFPFLKSIAKYVAIRHYRATSKLNGVPESISFRDLMQAADNDVSRRALKSWHRPRYNVYFPIRCVDNGYPG